MIITTDNPIDTYIKLCLSFINNSLSKNKCCTQYTYTNIFNILSFKIDNKLANLIMECLGYKATGNKLSTLENHYLNIQAAAELLAELESNRKSRFTFGMNFNMGVKRKGGCLSSLFVVGKGSKLPTVYITFKTLEIPKKFFADLLFLESILKRLGLYGAPVVIFSAAMFYWLLPSQALLPLFGIRKIKNPIILNSGFFKGRYEYRGVASLKENNQNLIKRYGKWIMEKGLLNSYIKRRGLDE